MYIRGIYRIHFRPCPSPSESVRSAGASTSRSGNGFSSDKSSPRLYSTYGATASNLQCRGICSLIPTFCPSFGCASLVKAGPSSSGGLLKGRLRSGRIGVGGGDPDLPWRIDGSGFVLSALAIVSAGIGFHWTGEACLSAGSVFVFCDLALE